MDFLNENEEKATEIRSEFTNIKIIMKEYPTRLTKSTIISAGVTQSFRSIPISVKKPNLIIFSYKNY